MKILITGGSGLLGQYLNLILSKDFDILTLYKTNIGNCDNYNSKKTDIIDFTKLNYIFETYNPDAVIHTAGFTRPEACNEENKNEVYKTNVEATKILSQLCDKYNVKLIYMSTDLVYDGNKGGMIKENGALNPVTLYADSKLKAEREISETFDNFIILRTSLLIGFGLNHTWNNFHVMYNNFKEGKRPRLFTDQYRTPLSLINAAEIISQLAKSDVKNVILNFGGPKRVSRVELGEMLCEISGFDKNLIYKIKMSDIPGFHAVADVSLNTDKLQSLGFKQKSLEEAILEIVECEM
ncbi:MAG: NAD(P)-dependent oxidoreductase [Ignavibacteriae bacterium]|nr:NAD(P)-dependent oxidoreductase [Ignavibacteriota bacterium]